MLSVSSSVVISNSVGMILETFLSVDGLLESISLLVWTQNEMKII